MKTDPAVHAARRARLAATMGAGVALVPTSPEVARNRDSLYPYRHDSYFYHLTGFVEPEAVVAVVAGDVPKSILFCRDKNPERETWDGFRHGPESARDVFLFDEAHPISALAEELPRLLADQPVVYTPVGLAADWDAKVTAALNAVRAQARTGVSAPAVLHDVRALLDEMRVVKDAHEVELMRRSASIAASAHLRAMQRTWPGMWEYQIEAEIAHEFLRFGAMSHAYPPIVASGPNACVLHYRDNDRRMLDGDLLLVDAGCEFASYASDITRTFPVNGLFSGAQRAVYELVLAAQVACVGQVGPGKRWNDYQDTAVRVLAQGLIDLGLCRGSLDSVIESEDYKRFYMHRAGHWLGLDVHDAGEYRHGGQWRTLVPGMVLTVEPGLYIRPADEVPREFWSIGVRIEDDVLVTAEGNEVLTAEVPKAPEDVEAAMRQRRAR